MISDLITKLRHVVRVILDTRRSSLIGIYEKPMIAERYVINVSHIALVQLCAVELYTVLTEYVIRFSLWYKRR